MNLFQKDKNKQINLLPSNVYEFIVVSSILGIVSIEFYLKYINNSYGYKSCIFTLIILILITLILLLIIKLIIFFKNK